MSDNREDNFSLWAPRAKDVNLVLGNIDYPMLRSDDGWWSAKEQATSAGIDYWFSIDGHMLPDPRSQWQPAGVFGPSRKVNHADHPWSDSHWQPPPLESAIFYELHVGTFSRQGTFAGARERIGYLKKLGITHINLMPVNEFSGVRGWGYDGVFVFALHHAYGGPHELKNFVNACHQEGLAVILDVVFNHLGPEGNVLESFGPYFSDTYRLPWGKAMNFDGLESNEVRRYFCDCARMWIQDYHFDGLRIDAVQSMFDTSAIHILEELTSRIKLLEGQLERNIVLIAESDANDPWIINSTGKGGCGFDAQWSDDFHRAIHALLTQERNGYYADFGSMTDLAKAITGIFVLDGQYSKFRRRNYGRPAGTSAGDKFIVYLENHDYAGHRADGRRFSQLIDKDKIKIAAAILLTAPFIPMLFQAEEWGGTSRFHYFTNFRDSKLAKQVQDGRKKELNALGWNAEDVPDPQAFSTFEQCKVDWDEPDTAAHSEILKWYRALITLRRNNSNLHAGSVQEVSIEYDENEKWLLLKRKNIITVANLGENIRRVLLPKNQNRTQLLASDSKIVLSENKIVLPSCTVAILSENSEIRNSICAADEKAPRSQRVRGVYPT